MRRGSFFKRFSVGTSWLWLGAFAIIPNLALLIVALLDKESMNFFIPLLTLDNFIALDPANGQEVTASYRYVLYGDACEHVSDLS